MRPYPTTAHPSHPTFKCQAKPSVWRRGSFVHRHPRPPSASASGPSSPSTPSATASRFSSTTLLLLHPKTSTTHQSRPPSRKQVSHSSDKVRRASRFQVCVWRLRFQVGFKCYVWRLLPLFYFRQGVGKICEVCTSECLLTFHVRDRSQAGSPSWTVTDVDSLSVSLLCGPPSPSLKTLPIVVCQSGQGRVWRPCAIPTINDHSPCPRPEEASSRDDDSTGCIPQDPAQESKCRRAYVN
jgi:hypothetical protein